MKNFKDYNYYQIQGFMVNKLNLSGNELLIYAIIYGFSQDDDSVFKGSLAYLQCATNSSRNTVINSINKLIQKKLIIKLSIGNNFGECNQYKYCPSAISDLVQFLTKPSAISAPNNNIYNNNIIPPKKLEDYLLLEVNESVSEIKNYEFLQSSLGFRNLFLYNCNKLGIKNISQLENPNYIKFSDPLRLLIDKDKYTIEDLRTVYDYLKNSKDDFWKAQILSTNNLRDKFNKLIASANIDKKQAVKTIKKPTLNI